MAYDHRNYEHLCLLAGAINDLQNRHLAELNALASGRGLMRTHWWIETIVKLGTLRGASREKVWRVIYMRDLDLNQTARGMLVDHMLKGKDASDPHSAGGFNETELAMIEMKLHEFGAYLPLPQTSFRAAV